ncbi:Acetyltransferase (GNAT) family protein [Asanoa hainanensis]|uniref:Acetyltransferase (GNAT) family protein n=1 Tax=Asanoa hainanensis TaxID=560556 RepID=A0A239M1V0_9ACTN|nr:GNAT family N-acetyltransferase [Asanoa hainanensis]SNT36550.1 Acetyltransferase (GNAT) family protein [Asanoa hainanensis]
MIETLPELVLAWGRGWAVSRRVPDPVDIPGGFRADVGLPGHRVRYVLHTWDADELASLARDHSAPGTWIKVSGHLRGALPDPWVIDSAGYLMTAPFTVGTRKPPAPYETRVTTDGEVVVATVVDATGATAAYGRLAPAGEYGVVDRVETAPAHRRRGLGTTVMSALSDQAARDGLRTGILLATDDGRRLYGALGWTVRSEFAAAYVRED